MGEAHRHRLISPVQASCWRALLTAVSAVRRDCKEKEELIQRVLESSSARALLPDLELDGMVCSDDKGVQWHLSQVVYSDSDEADARGSGGGEPPSKPSPEPPAVEAPAPIF